MWVASWVGAAARALRAVGGWGWVVGRGGGQVHSTIGAARPAPSVAWLLFVRVCVASPSCLSCVRAVFPRWGLWAVCAGSWGCLQLGVVGVVGVAIVRRRGAAGAPHKAVPWAQPAGTAAGAAAAAGAAGTDGRRFSRSHVRPGPQGAIPPPPSPPHGSGHPSTSIENPMRRSVEGVAAVALSPASPGLHHAAADQSRTLPQMFFFMWCYFVQTTPRPPPFSVFTRCRPC
jgi:hypothetical protein